MLAVEEVRIFIAVLRVVADVDAAGCRGPNRKRQFSMSAAPIPCAVQP